MVKTIFLDPIESNIGSECSSASHIQSESKIDKPKEMDDTKEKVKGMMAGKTSQFANFVRQQTDESEVTNNTEVSYESLNGMLNLTSTSQRNKPSFVSVKVQQHSSSKRDLLKFHRSERMLNDSFIMNADNLDEGVKIQDTYSKLKIFEVMDKHSLFENMTVKNPCNTTRSTVNGVLSKTKLRLNQVQSNNFAFSSKGKKRGKRNNRLRNLSSNTSLTRINGMYLPGC